jgi:nickel-dependent lactate racemase
METVVAYGKSGLKLDLPSGPDYEVIAVKSAAALSNAERAIEAALDSPVGCVSLLEMARGKRTAAISVCDITRPAPNKITLPPILKRLHQAGLRHRDISICIATGLHRKATEAELQEILGPEIASCYPIVNHDAKILQEHKHLGVTAKGTPVYIDHRFVDADLHITLGFIEQHFMLGFSGGRKLIVPGLAAQETIKVIHSPRFMREKLAIEGSIEENPLHAELLEIARMARHDFILDVTLTHDRQISGVFAGEPVQAHAAGVQFVRESSIGYLPEYVDAAITSAAGHPLDLTFYQTIKGISAVQHIVKPGGKILCIGECSEGIGSPEFAAKLRNYKGAQNFLDEIQGAPVVPDQWQLEKLALIALRYDILFFTPGVDAQLIGTLQDKCFARIEDALRSLVSGLLPKARVAIIPDGPYACVRVAP